MSPLYVKEVNSAVRDVNLLVHPKFKRITDSHNAIKYPESKLWNNLPNDFKTLDSLSSFKCEIQKWSGPVSLWVLSAV